MINDIVLKTSEAASYISSRITSRPKIAIILSKGLAEFACEVKENRVEILYDEIPNFPKTKRESYGNKLIFGRMYDKDIVIMQEKFYYYEGFDMDEITFPISVMALLGVETMIISSASGSITKELAINDIMLIKDHINICGISPLRGHDESEFGTISPIMTNIYSSKLLELAKDVASLKAFDNELDKKVIKKFKYDNDLIINLKEGIYAYMPGPQYETNAEVKMLGILGADSVGMSLVPEVITASSLGMQVLGISYITNHAGNKDLFYNQEEKNDEVEEKIKNLIMRIIMKM